MLESLWNLLAGVLASVWGLLATVVVFLGDAALWLHVEAPRLEGLLVGVLLAWLMARRDQHPLLRAASAPLKLVLDILDLAWDQVVEVAGDVWGTAKQWTLGCVGWAVGKLREGYRKLLSWLGAAKAKLQKQGGDE